MDIQSLHSAVKQLNYEVCENIIDNGANVNALDDDRKTPLFYAVQRETSSIISLDEIRRRIAELLIRKGANVNARTENGRTSLHMAVMHEFEVLVEVLLLHGASVDHASVFGSTGLTIAIERGYSRIVKILIDYGADVNAVQNGMRPLHRAASSQRQSEVTEVLLQHGADVNATLRNGKTALHLAAEKSHVLVMKALLTSGAKANIVDENGRTATHGFGCRGGRLENASEVFVSLQKHGFDFNALSKDRKTPIYMFVERWMSRQGNGRQIELGDHHNQEPWDPWSFFQCGKERLDPEVSCGVRPWKNRLGAVLECCLKAGADPNVVCVGGGTLLHKCAGSYAGYEEEVEILLLHGAAVDAQNEAGETALHLAVEKEFDEIIKALVQNGANIFIQNYLGETPHDLYYDETKCALREVFEIVPSITLATRAMKLERLGLHSELDPPPCRDLRFMHLLNADTSSFEKELVRLQEQRLYDDYTLHCFLTMKPMEKPDVVVEALKHIDIYDYPDSTWLIKRRILLFAQERGIEMEFSWNTVLNGVPPLHRAVRKGAGRLEVFRILHQHGRESCRAVCNGKTALHLAAETCQARVVTTLLNHGADVNAADSDGLTPLFSITKCRRENSWDTIEESMEALLKAGADANATFGDGATLLHGIMCSLERADRYSCRGLSLKCFKLLLDFGADVDKRNHAGETALHLGSRASSEDIKKHVQMLLDYGADLFVKNNLWETAVGIVRSTYTPLPPGYENGFNAAEGWNVLREKLSVLLSSKLKEAVMDILLDHWTKLMAVGLAPSQDLQSLDGSVYLSEIRQEIQREADELTNHRLCGHRTLHCILFEKSEPSRDEYRTIVQTLKSLDFKKYPHYGELLQTTLRNHKRRYELRLLARKWLTVLIKTRNALCCNKLSPLPEEIVAIIISNLSVRDLKALISCGEQLRNQLKKPNF